MSAKKIATVVVSALLLATAIGWFATRDDAREALSGAGPAPVAVVEIPAAEGTTGAAAPDLVPTPGTIVIRGEVRDRHSDRPLGGATIAVTPEASDSALAVARSGSDGSYSLELPARIPARSAEIRITARGHLPASKTRSADTGQWPDPLPVTWLGAGHTVEGEVIDGRGRPVAGAEVLLWGGVGLESNGPISTRRTSSELLELGSTDAEGRFRGTAPRGEALLVAFDGDRAGSISLTIPVPGGAPLILPLEGLPDVRGRVVDETGAPVPGSKLVVWLDEATSGIRLPDAGSWSPTGTTGEDGIFRIQTLGYTCRARVSHERFPTVHQLDLGALVPGVEATIVLPCARTVRGVCTLAGGGSPGERQFRLAPDFSRGEGRLGADGSFEVSNIATAATTLTLQVQGSRPIQLDLPAGVEDVDLGSLALDAGASVSVSVSDVDGLPIAGAGVRITENLLSSPRPVRHHEARTDPSGVASFPGVAETSARLNVWADGYDKSDQEVAIPDDGSDLGVTLERSGELRGRIVDSRGDPVGGLQLTLERIPAPEWGTGLRSETEFPDLQEGLLADLTEDDGLFRFPAVPARTDLRFRVRSLGMPAATVPIEALASGESRDLGDIPLAGTLGLEVSVIDAAGTPLPGATAELRAVGAGVRDGVVVAAGPTGIARFRGLRPGSFVLSAHAEARLPAERTVDLRADGAAISIVLERGRTWEVLIRDTDGVPIPGAKLNIWGFESASGIAAGITAEDGRATLAGVPDRVRSFDVDADGFIGLRDEPRSAELPKEIVLSRAAGLRLIFERPEWGPPLRSASLRVRQSNGSVTSTTFRSGMDPEMREVAPGPAEVEVLAEGYARFIASVELVAGEVTEVRFEPTAAARTFSVRVVDERGTPFSEARVRARRRDPARFGAGNPLTDLPLVEEGRYAAEIAEAGSRLDVVAEAPGYGPTAVEDVAADSEPVISLQPAARIELRVSEADGSPAVTRGVMVRPSRHTSVLDPQERSPSVPRSPDAEGRLVFEGLAATSYRVYVLDAGTTIHSEEVTLIPGESREVEIAVPPRIDIFGRVTRNGSPLSEGRILVQSGSGFATLLIDERGGFRGTVADAPVAEFRVQYRDAHQVDFRGIEVRQGREIALDFDTVEGEIRLIGPDGRPFGPVSGTVHSIGDGSTGHVPLVTGADGIARITDLLRGKQSVHLALEPDRVLLDGEFEAPSEPVTLQVAAAAPLRVRLARPGSVNVSGYRIDEDGRYGSLPWPNWDANARVHILTVPAEGTEGAVVLIGDGLAPLVLDLSAGVPVDPVTLPDLPGGSAVVEPFPAARGSPVAFRVEPRVGPPLHPALARRLWSGEKSWLRLPIGRYLVVALGADGDLGSCEVEVTTGAPATARW